MPERRRLSIGYGIVMALVLVFASYVTMRFSISVQELAANDHMTRFLVVAVDFFLIFLVAVTLGFTSLFFKIDTVRMEYDERMDRIENLLESVAANTKDQAKTKV